MSKIFLHEPHFFSDEIKNISRCIKTGWVSTGGQFVSEFENRISKFTKSKFSLALNSGTSALDLSLKVLSIKERDEIIVPTITFIAPINVVLYNNCSPIFMDVDNYGNIDPKKVIEFITNQTVFKNGFTINKKTGKKIKAIILVHVFGNIVEINKIIRLCKKRNIKVIEDASESLGTYFANKSRLSHSGTLGDIGCISFNANKIITTGAGGAILTNSKIMYDKLYYLSTQAKNDPINFIHDEVGYNMRLNNISAAIGVSQFKSLNKILAKKKSIHDYYKKKLSKLKNFEILTPPKYSKSNYWINLLKLKGFNSDKYKDDIIKIFFDNGIQVRPVWYPNHLQKKMLKFQKYKLENFYKYCNTIICLPSGYSLNKKQLDIIINVITKLDKNEKFKNNSKT